MQTISFVRGVCFLMIMALCGCLSLCGSPVLAQDAQPKAETPLPPPMPGTPFFSITKMRCKGDGEHNHIVYLLDTSGSMAYEDKINKTKMVLKKTLRELRPTDTFNVIGFDDSAHAFSSSMHPATPGNIKRAVEFIDALKLAPYTNYSAGMDAALKQETATHIFLMSDGEPHGGIEDFDRLREFVKSKNTRKAHIYTFALGLGERFPGMRLLRSIAEDNDGEYSYINLLKSTATPDAPKTP